MRGVIDDSKLENIAEAIRKKTGTETKYTPEEMPGGVAEVYDKGRTDEWSEFWDSFQNYGKRTNYSEQFGYYASNSEMYWNDITYKPKYDICPTALDRGYAHTKIVDFMGIHERQGIKFDTSKCWIFHFCFTYTPIAHLPEISCISTSDIYYTFAECYSLHTIDKLVVNNTGNTKFTGSFGGLVNLKNIVFEGVIGQNISFPSSPLTVESIKSIITHLKNYSGTGSEYTYTLTLKSDRWALLDAEGATSPSGTLWREYVDELGWLTA